MDITKMIWHIIWNNTIYGCGIYECILLYTIRIWYGTVIEDILWIYKPTVFNIGEIETVIYIWLYLVCQRWDTKWRLLPGKKAKSIMGDMIINVFLKLGYTLYIYTHMVILMPGNSWLKSGFRGSLFSNIPTWCFPETKLLIK